VVYVLGSIIAYLFAYVSKPVLVVRTWLTESTDTVPMYFRERSALIDEIAVLEEQLSAKSGSAVTLARVTRENEELRALLGGGHDQRIAAGVVARPPFLPYDALLIDRGTAHGIQKNAIVYHFNDQAIGFVSRVFEQSALVTLFSTAGAASTVYIMGPDIYTTAYGMGGGVVRVSVPQGIALAAGNVVLLPSLHTGHLGRINSVQSVSTQPEQYGFVTADIPIQSLRLVSVSTQVFEPITFEEVETYIASLTYDMLKIDVPADVLAEVGTSTVASSTPLTASSTPSTQE